MGKYRIPSGAVTNGSRICFMIADKVKTEKLLKVKLYIIHDDTNELEVLDMKYENVGYYKLTKTFNKPALYWYFYEFVTKKDSYFFGADEKLSKYIPVSFQLNVYDKRFTTPDWLKGGLIYHIFVDRFCRKGLIPYKENSILRYDWDNGIPFRTSDGGKTYCNDFFGGNLKGIISKLDYLQELGVTCIFLSPIYSADSNHRYDSNDHMKIDKMVGNEFWLWLLCKKAKRKGIRVILDIAFNHVGSNSKYFNDPKYDEWFTRYNDGSYDCWWGFPTLPSIKKQTPESYKEHVTKVVRKWLKIGVSGFRLDVADELSNELLKHIRKAVKSVKSEAVIFGEVWEDMSNKSAYGERKNYLEGDKLDSGMNYPFRKSILEFVKYGNSKQLIDTINSIKDNYPKQVQHILMNMLSSHDEIRLATYLDNDIKRIKLSILLQMTLIGVPCIYYGDEKGMEGEKDPYNRKPMLWAGGNKEIYNFYKELIEIRKSSNALMFGNIFVKESKEGTIRFSRRYKNECVEIFVDANNLTYEIN